MIRITTSSLPKATKVTVDGQLMGEYVDAVALCCRQAIGQGKAVHVVLREVGTIDENGRALLAKLAAEGVHLSASEIYGGYVVAGVCREARRRMLAK